MVGNTATRESLKSIKFDDLFHLHLIFTTTSGRCLFMDGAAGRPESEIEADNGNSNGAKNQHVAHSISTDVWRAGKREF